MPYQHAPRERNVARLSFDLSGLAPPTFLQQAIPNCFTDPAGLFFLHSKKQPQKGVAGAWQRMRTIVKVELARWPVAIFVAKCFDKARPTSDKA